MRPRIPLVFSPLAADERFFRFDDELRRQTRTELQVVNRKLAMLSGKTDHVKRSIEAISALADAGWYVLVVGRCSADIEADIRSRRDVHYISHVDANRLNALYCAADLAVFTTFSVSYWEAAATGLHLLVPRTSFSEQAFEKREATLFGREAMFSVPEEQYRPETSVYAEIKAALPQLRCCSDRRTVDRFLWTSKAGDLVRLYEHLICGDRT